MPAKRKPQAHRTGRPRARKNKSSSIHIAQSGRGVKPHSARYASLKPREKAAYDRTTNLISDLRAGKGPYHKLLREHHLDTRTAHKYGGRELLGGSRGKPVRASKADRRTRELLFPTSFGDAPVRTRSSKDATKLSKFFHDRDKLLRGKLSAADFEAKWRGVRIADKELFADSAAISHMANAGELRVESLYASTGGAR